MPYLFQETDVQLVGVNPTIEIEQIQSGGVLFDPIRSDMLGLYKTTQQVSFIRIVGCTLHQIFNIM